MTYSMGFIDFELEGSLSVPEGTNQEELFADFLAWVESKGGTFEGTIGPIES